MNAHDQQAVSLTRRSILPRILTLLLAGLLTLALIASPIAADPAFASAANGTSAPETPETNASRPTVLTFFEWYFDANPQAPFGLAQPRGLGAKMNQILLDVPLVMQFPIAPSGCEIASLTMLLDYAGYPTTLEESLQTIPYSGDATLGFAGNPRGWDGWTIYPEAAGPWVAERLGSYQNLTGASLDQLRDVLRQGKPIVIWMFHPNVGYHSLCMSGFDEQGFYLNDPYGYKDWYIGSADFERSWSGFNRMALSY